jgi:hypothetical protein
MDVASTVCGVNIFYDFYLPKISHLPCIFSQILLIEKYVAGFKRRNKIVKKTALFPIIGLALS